MGYQTDTQTALDTVEFALRELLKEAEIETRVDANSEEPVHDALEIDAEELTLHGLLKRMGVVEDGKENAGGISLEDAITHGSSLDDLTTLEEAAQAEAALLHSVDYLGLAALYADEGRGHGIPPAYAGYGNAAKQEFTVSTDKEYENRIRVEVQQEVEKTKVAHLFGQSTFKIVEDEQTKLWKMANQGWMWVLYDLS